MKIAVIPGKNVEKFVYDVISKTMKHVDEVIFVNDGSTDSSAQKAEEAGATVIGFKKNRGKGFALQKGFREALKKNPDVVLMLDSDGQHKPEEIPLLIQELEKGYDAVIGSRYAGKFYTIPRNVLGNYGLNFMINFLSYGPHGLLGHRWLGDTQSGFRAFKANSLKKLHIEGRRYEIESELCFESAVKGLSVKEVPITISHWVRGVSVKDGLKNGLFVFKKRFKL